MRSTIAATTIAASTRLTSQRFRFQSTADATADRLTPGLLTSLAKTSYAAHVVIRPSAGAVEAEATLRYLRNRPELFLTDVYVSPSLRGRGWGREVVLSALRIAALEKKVVFTFANSHGRGPRPELDDLDQFYCSCGFKPLRLSHASGEVLRYAPA